MYAIVPHPTMTIWRKQYVLKPCEDRVQLETGKLLLSGSMHCSRRRSHLLSHLS